MDDFLFKFVGQLGVPGLVVFLGYRLLNKHMGRFGDAQTKLADSAALTAKTMSEMVAAVSAAHDEQKDVVLAVRVLTTKVDDLVGWVKEKEQGSRR